MIMSLNFQINGQKHTASCPAGTSLLSLLRQQGWMGVHRVCETGDCGSCTVWVDGTPLHSCIYPAPRVEGCDITTIEGLGKGGLSPMQQAFLEEEGFQCGYCTPGMIMTAEKLQFDSVAELRQALDGNLCRCTGYQAIVESIKRGKGIEPEFRDVGCKTSSQVGQSVPKQDGPDIVTGKPVYTADWAPPGLLHLKVLRSPHPHAHIRRIDTCDAKALPGVRAVFSYEDVTRRPYSTAGHAEPVPDPHDHYLLDHKVRFVGDRVAAVVADSAAIAEQACGLIEVDYEILPHVTDPIAAMAENCPIIHDEPDSYQIHDAQHNIAGEVRLQKGDVAAGFMAADLVVERTYHLPAVQHFHLEPHVSISWLEADGTLAVRSSTQVPFHCQRLLSQLFDLPKDKVRVFKAKIGGGFGNKQEIITEDLCVLATLRTGRPVQWEFTRNEELTATNSRHAMQIHLKIGVKQDGTLTAMEMTAIANTGAYGNHGTQVVFLTGSMPLGLYSCPNQRFFGRSIYTNTMPAGAFRGYGSTQGCFAMECLLDEIAHKLDLDPIEMRQRQLVNPNTTMLVGREYPNDTTLIGREHHFNLIGSYGLGEALEKVTLGLGYQPGMPTPVGESGGNPTPNVEHLRRGIGFAFAMEGSGLAKIHLAKVRMALKPDGRYEMRTGSVDLGTGSETTLRQIAAEVLGTTVAQIDIITGDTLYTPFDAGAYASATLYISGQAVSLAATQLRSRLLEIAGRICCAPLEELELIGSTIRSNTQVIDLQTLVQKAAARNEAVEVEQEYAADHSSVTFAVQGVEVEVDTTTGRITLLRCVQAVDIGKAINPRICYGQVRGAMVMGLGYALSEQLLFDAQGRILNPTPRTYRLPLAKDVPPMEVILVEQPDPYGPFGAKAIGEVGVNCMAPAIANAVANATGVRLRQLPMTPERVWQALQERTSDS